MMGLGERDIVTGVADVVDRIQNWLFIRRFKKYMKEYEEDRKCH